MAHKTDSRLVSPWNDLPEATASLRSRSPSCGRSSRLRRYAGHAVPANRAVVGDRLFDVESGIIAGWVGMCGEESPTEIFPYHWDLVGQRPAEVVRGKSSGLASIAIWLDGLGLEASDKERDRLLALVKERSLEQKSLLDEKMFRDLYKRVVERGRERAVV
jgi:isopropylmalate/homocitrate/citramalate synthase